MIRRLSLILLLGLSPLCFAEDADSPWSGSASMGLENETGNTDETNLDGSLDLIYTEGQNSYQTTLSAEHDKSDDKTDETYQAFFEAKHHYTDKNYTFFNTDYLDDDSDGYDYRWNSALGLGRRIFEDDVEHSSLDIQAGPGYRRAPNDDDGLSDDQWTLNGSAIYQRDVTEDLSFEQTVGTSIADENTSFTAKTTLESNLYKDLALALSFEISYDTEAPDDTKKTNSSTTLELVYNI